MASSERLQRRRGERSVVDRGERVSLEPALEPARGDAGIAVRLFERDQGGQLEQVAERGPRDLCPQRRLGERDVAPLDRPFEDRPW
jgi:hypothetical protein